jgi:hypothetical protein
VTTPVILSIDPSTVIAGSPSFTLTVNGANFAAGAIVKANGFSQLTNVVSSSQLTATIQTSVIATAGNVSITVTNPGSTTSSAVTLTVAPNQPTITSLDPTSVPIGNQNVTITVTGTNFASTAQVRVNNSGRQTTFVSDTTLKFDLIPSDISHTGTLSVVVLNPNNKLSNSVTLQVTQGSVPVITVLSPNQVNAGSAAFTLTVVGSSFVSTSVIKVNGTSQSTTFVDSSHLTTPITSTQVKTAGTLSITVTNPNSQVSNTATFTIANPNLPTITAISPTSVTQNAASFTLSITGTNFVTNTKVNIGTATPRSATIVDAQHMNVTIFTSDVSKQGSVPISVTTPAPNGGTSNILNLTVVSTLAPKLTSISPSTVEAGSETFKLLMVGSGFKVDDIAQFNGTAIPTEFISTTQLAGTIDASLIAAAATVNITVAHKDGSGTSAPLILTVTSATAPVIASFSPPNANVGDAPFTLAITGTNFASTSVVTLDDSPRTTTFVSATDLTIDLSASDLDSAHDFIVDVINSGGLSSPDATFSVSVPVPTIATISPDTVISGDAGFQLTVTGTNLSPTSVINVDGVPHSTQQQPSTGALITTVAASEIASYGDLSITVTDNGTTSSPASLTALRPTIDSIDPSAIVLGSLSATLRVTGSAFLSTSKVIFKNVEQPTTFNTDGSLTAILNGADLLDAGLFAINVRNSPLSLSIPVLLTIASPGSPVITAVSAVAVGSTTATVSGANFVPLSVVRINGADRATTFLGGNQLSVQFESGDTAGPGTLTVTVRNPDGTISGPFSLTVTGEPVIPIHRRGARH